MRPGLLTLLLLGMLGAPTPARSAARLPPLLGLPKFGLNVAQVPAGQYVFTEAQEWTRFWGQYSARPAPQVDFSRGQVAAVFLGARPNPGYAVRITGYALQGGQAAVSFHEYTPARGAVWAQVISYPADLVVLPAGARVQFTGTRGPLGLMQPVARPLPYQRVEVAGLTAPAPGQYVAFPTAQRWEAFWGEHGKGPLPAVDFARGQMVVGVVGLPEGSAMTLSQVTRAGELITVTLGPGTQPACPSGSGESSLLLIVPQVSRVDFQYLPFCK